MNYMVSWSRSSDQPVVTIYLPKLHRANAFLHVLIGHELFHPAIEPFFPAEKAIITPKLREECKQLLAKLEGDPELFAQHRLDAILSHALEAWERGLTELMCDMGAASLFGPAALWTISGFAALQNLDIHPSTDNQFYPPWRMRVHAILNYILQVDDGQRQIEKICEALKLSGLTAHADAIARSIEDEKEICSDDEISKHSFRDQLITTVYQHVSESLTRAREFVRNIATGIAARWTATCDQVPGLLKRLALLVPPSELLQAGKQISAAADMSAIILACWIERLMLEQRHALGLGDYRRLCRLMLKAIEDSELKRQFAAWEPN
jgi:hypothetical protein